MCLQWVYELGETLLSACLSTERRQRRAEVCVLDGGHSQAWWQEPRTQWALITSSRSRWGVTVHVEILKGTDGNGWCCLCKNKVHKRLKLHILSIDVAANRTTSTVGRWGASEKSYKENQYHTDHKDAWKVSFTVTVCSPKQLKNKNKGKGVELSIKCSNQRQI